MVPSAGTGGAVEGERRKGLGVWAQQIETIIYRMENNKIILSSTGDNIQYPVIKFHGKG